MIEYTHAAILTATAILLLGCESKEATEPTREIAPGLHVDTPNASSCADFSSPTTRVAIEGSALSLELPEAFEINQRATPKHRQLILKHSLKEGALTLRVMEDIEPAPSSSFDALRIEDGEANGASHKKLDGPTVGGEARSIYLTDRGADVTARVFLDAEDGQQRQVALFASAGMARACHQPLIDATIAAARSISEK